MYYFIGIKGTGMAALAVMLHDLGKDVCGSDLSKHFFTEDELVKRNIPIYDFNPDNIKDGYTVVPTKLYLKNGKAKLEIALGKGKKNFDKRETIKERDDKRNMAKALKRN